jgi:hypothetical protein
MIFSHRYEYTYTDTHGRDPLGPWNGYAEGGAISGMAHGKDEGLSMIIASEYILNAFPIPFIFTVLLQFNRLWYFIALKYKYVFKFKVCMHNFSYTNLSDTLILSLIF